LKLLVHSLVFESALPASEQVLFKPT